MKKENMKKRRKLYKQVTACGLTAIILFSGIFSGIENQSV